MSDQLVRGAGPSGYPTPTHPLLPLGPSRSSSVSTDATLVDTFVPRLVYRDPRPLPPPPPERVPRDGLWGAAVDAVADAAGACLDGVGYVLWCMVS